MAERIRSYCNQPAVVGAANPADMLTKHLANANLDKNLEF